MSHARRLALALAATCLVAALVGAPTATAAGGAKSAAAQSAPKAKSSQSAKTLAKRISTVSKRANRNRRNITALGKSLTALGTELRNAITGGDKTIDDKINGIVGAVTPVLTRLGTGLTDLAAGVQTLAAATTKGFDDVKAGFDEVEAAITTVATSQEYGVTGLFLTFDPGDGETTVRGPTVGSADIPDDGNQVSASGTVPVTISGTPSPPATFPPNTRVSLRSAIRSGENGDGEASGDPAGQVGGLLYVKDASGATGAGNGGNIICSVGPTANSNFTLPTGVTPLPLKNIQQAAARTDQTRPNATDVNPVSGAAVSPGPLPNSGEGSCTLPAPGTYEIVVQTQFVDLPTSADPDADD